MVIQSGEEWVLFFRYTATLSLSKVDWVWFYNPVLSKCNRNIVLIVNDAMVKVKVVLETSMTEGYK